MATTNEKIDRGDVLFEAGFQESQQDSGHSASMTGFTTVANPPAPPPAELNTHGSGLVGTPKG